MHIVQQEHRPEKGRQELNFLLNNFVAFVVDSLPFRIGGGSSDVN